MGVSGGEVLKNRTAIKNQICFEQSSRFMKGLWAFSRPHTIIGTTLQVFIAYLFASSKSGLFVEYLDLAFKTWLSCIALNIYVVGLNQIIDIPLDRVNKPYLPLASGEFSKEFGVFLTTTAGVVALVSSLLLGEYLLMTVASILFIGTLYSIPGCYLKGNPIGAALGIATARGLILNMGAFLFFSKNLLNTDVVPSYVIAFALFAFGFGVVISMTKDLPDLQGDRLYGVRTLTVRLGVQPVLNLSLGILTLSYFGLTLISLKGLQSIPLMVLGFYHLGVLSYVFYRRFNLDCTDSSELHRFYMMFWKLFYQELVFFPLCVLAA